MLKSRLFGLVVITFLLSEQLSKSIAAVQAKTACKIQLSSADSRQTCHPHKIAWKMTQSEFSSKFGIIIDLNGGGTKWKLHVLERE